MTIANTMDRLVKWTEENICSKIKLKVPPEDIEAATDADYEYKEASPACFPIYIPTRDKLPPGADFPIPSVCIRILDGTDYRNSGSLNIEMNLSCWNPGTYGKDVLLPNNEKPGEHREWAGEEAEQYYKRNAGGWRDIWNWIDIILKELEATTDIDGIPIDKENGIKYEPYKEEGGIADYYPFWYATVSFTLKRRSSQNKKIDEYL